MPHQSKDSLDFVTRHYRRDTFKARRGPWLTVLTPGRAVAAASVAAVALVAVAAGWHYRAEYKQPKLSTVQVALPPVANRTDVIAMSFDNATVTEVAQAVESRFGLRLDGVPETDMRLTLECRGTADDIVAMINDIAGCNITIADR